ncbi:hypothetical protein B0H11DRAFT_1958185 [Mycena galericulata]|nr:hypothetical protein B0H11DRAFT_1958185 [Mycena galericulata]
MRGSLPPVAAAPSPPSFMAGLLQRGTPPVPPAYEALNVTPPPPQQVWDAPAPRASNSPGPLPRQNHRFLWSRKYMFLLALPGLAILTTVVGLILPLRDAFEEAIPERIFVLPPPLPPHLLRPRRPYRRHAKKQALNCRLERQETQGPEDAATHAERLHEIQRRISQTEAVRGEIPQDEEVEREVVAEKARVEQISEIRRRILRLWNRKRSR